MNLYKQKSADLRWLFTKRGLRMPIKSNKQQETYADMTTHYTDCRCSMDIVIPIGIYCYFGFDLIEKLRSFRFVKRKAQ